MARTHTRAPSSNEIGFWFRGNVKAEPLSCEVPEQWVNKSCVRHQSFIRTETSAEAPPQPLRRLRALKIRNKIGYSQAERKKKC